MEKTCKFRKVNTYKKNYLKELIQFEEETKEETDEVQNDLNLLPSMIPSEERDKMIEIIECCNSMEKFLKKDLMLKFSSLDKMLHLILISEKKFEFKFVFSCDIIQALKKMLDGSRYRETFTHYYNDIKKNEIKKNFRIMKKL